MASEPANVEVFEQKSTCGRRWQLHENLVLIAGKENQELELEKAKKEKIEKTNKEKWEEIETYCHQNGIDRSAEQCRLRWHRLMLAFSKVKNWESRRRPGKLSFWLMKADERREKGLPFSLDWEAFNALDELHSKKGITCATTHFLSEKADSSKFKSTESPSYEVNLRRHIVDEAEMEGCAEVFHQGKSP